MKKPNRILLVFKYLWENTDDTHKATIADITSYLEAEGVIVKDYRVIQRDIADLASIGVDIIEKRKQRYEYNIGERLFEVPEVKLLIDAVQSSRFISNKQSKALIRKLASFVGPHNANLLKRQLYIDQRSKATNESIMRSVDAVQEAIGAKKKVTFQYFDYSPTKEKVARHGGLFYRVSPYSLIWSGDNYYMVGFSEDKSLVQKFRIDRIDHLSVLDEGRKAIPKGYRVGDFFSQEFSMLSGKECDIELLVANPLMNSIIDRFGEKVETEIVDEDHFKVSVTVSLSSNFYGWVFASNGQIRILQPQEAINGFYSIMAQYQETK